MGKVASRARDFTLRRYRWGSRVDERVRAMNRRRSRVRSKVEHRVGVIKPLFVFQQVQYRGLAKSLHRLQVGTDLASLLMVVRRVLRVA